ncbi:MAG: hypothetical protein WAM60_11615 [Candidatus Promineifilaceae bacterium]
MSQSIINQPISMVEEDEATGEVAELYDTVKRELHMPFVPNMIKTLGVSPAALAIHMGMFQAMYAHLTLPQSLVAMISYTVAEYANCEYCSVNNELMCRTLGIDEETLAQVARDLGNVNPERVRVIIQFCLKVSKYPQRVTNEDFDRLRELGVNDEEILEIVIVTAHAVSADVIADTLKVPVESDVYAALGR